MIDFWTVFSAVMPAYCLVAVGVLLRKAEWLTHEADESLIRVVVNVLTPCLILDNVLNNEALRRADNLLLPPLFGFGGVLMGVAVAWLARRWVGATTEREQRTFACAAGFQNFGYAALPLIIQLFPRETTGVLFLHNLGVDTAMWTLGLVTLGHAGVTEWRKLVNAPLVAIKVNFPRGDWYALASLIAASTDSVPLLLKKLYFSLPGVKAASVFASMARSGSSSSWLWRGCFAS